MPASADTTMTIWGSGHFASGKTVHLSICGVDAGTATVQNDGSVVFTFGSDPGGIITPTYLVNNPSEGTDHDVTFSVIDSNGVTHTVTVPVLVGLTYTDKGQLIRPMAQAQLGAGPGPSIGNTRRAVWGSVLVRDCLALQMGTDLSNMYTVNLTTDGLGTPELAIAADAPFSGVLVHPLDDKAGLDSQLTWSNSKPYTTIIGGAAIFVEGAER